MIGPLAPRLLLIVTLIDDAWIAIPVVPTAGAETVRVGLALEAATIVSTADGQGVFAALSLVSAAKEAYHQ